MKKNLYIGTYFKVPVYIHASVLFLFGLLLLSGSGSPWFIGIPLAIAKGLIIYACVLAHEFGHIVMAQRLGYHTQKIVLMALGGAAVLDTTNMYGKPKHQLKVALAGPAVSVLLAGIGFGLTLLAKIAGLAAFPALMSLVAWVFFINLALTIFNLLPIFPLDGGRAFRALLSMKFGLAKATDYTFYTTAVLGTIAFVAALVYGDIMLAIIAPLLVLGAYAERGHVDKHENTII